MSASTRLVCCLVAGIWCGTAPAWGQTLAGEDPVWRRIWEEGMERSQAYALAQALQDSIGPTGTPPIEAGNAWLVGTYRRWGISAENEEAVRRMRASFVCGGAPGFGLGSLSWSYGTYTWHTNRDTFDKIAFDDVQNNATLTAMLVDLAAVDPERVSRDRWEILPPTSPGTPRSWPACESARRASSERRP